MIGLDEVDIPEGGPPLKKKTIEQLMMSLKLDGLLHPIGVREYTEEEIAADPGKRDRVELVYGRHRVAAALALGWTRLECKFLEEGGGGDAQSAKDAENVIRTTLRPAERIAGLARFLETYRATYGDPTPRTGKPGRPAGAAETIDARAAAKLGLDSSTVRRDMKAARALSADDLDVLDRREVPRKLIHAIAALDDEDRPRAVSLVASGMDPQEAIAHATLPEGAVVTVHPAGGEAPPLAEDELPDLEWLRTYCGEVLDRLPFKAAYEHDALLWRHTRAARKAFKDATLRAVGQGKAMQNLHAGGFHYMLINLLNVDHPRTWAPCGPCGGAGETDRGRCTACHGAGFRVGSARRKSR